MRDVTASGRAERIIRKYPEFLTSLCDIRTYEMAKSKSDATLRRVLRKDTERTRRLRRFRKTPYSRLDGFGSVLFDALDENKDIFTCPMCRKVLLVPTTVDCGHTFCGHCRDQINNGKCYCCQSDIGSRMCTNTLIQSLVDKWRESRRERQISNGSLVSETISALGLEPRYHLRSRYAGLLPKGGTSDDNVTEIISRFFIPVREKKRARQCDSFTNRNWKNGTSRHKNEYLTYLDISNRELFNEIQLKRSVKKFCEELDLTQDEVLKTSWSHIQKFDLECILCSRCFFDPVTTSCGHTFCRGCLIRVLDHGLSCPLCVSPLSNSEQSRGTTYTLEHAMRLLVPDELEQRKSANFEEMQVLDKGSQIPVFVCTNAFPGVACPLYVYEPRYRLLTRRCLQSRSRRFAMAVKAEKMEKFATYGTILEVKDAVLLQDGQFILTTLGVSRFKVLNKSEQDGYDTAEVQYIRDSIVPPEKLHDLVTLHHKVHSKAAKWVKSLTPHALAEVERFIGPMPRVEKNWTSLPDGPAWTWWLMPILPLSPQLQVGFLSTTNLEKRLRAIDKMFEHMKIRMKALERDTLNCTDTVETAESCGFTETPVHIPYNNH